MMGLEMAKELHRNGVSDILVVESGPADDLQHINATHDVGQASRLVLTGQDDKYFARTWTSVSPPHYTASSGLRRRLGGRSLYWHGVVLPIDSWALCEPWWSAKVIEDLVDSWRGGPSLYERVMTQLERWCGAGALARGLNDGDVVLTVGDYGFRTLPHAIREISGNGYRWSAYSALDYWWDPRTGASAGTSPGVRFLCNTDVVEVLVQNGTAAGIVVRAADTGETYEISADTVVLCAGTIENSRLAIQAVASVSATPTYRLGGLADHIIQGFYLRLDAELVRSVLGDVVPGSYVVPCEDATRSFLRIDLSRQGADEVLADVRTTGEQLPSPESYVECIPAPNCPWDISVRTEAGPEDRRLVESQRTVLKEFWRTLAKAFRVPDVPLTFDNFERPDRTYAFEVPEYMKEAAQGSPVTWSSPLGTEDHEGGTLPLGTVLDDHHEFRALPGLFAAGPSTFPRIGAANPSLTSLALAHRLAAILTG